MLDEPQIMSVAMVAPWLHNAEIVQTIYGGEDALKQRISQALAARATYTKSGVVEYVTAASNSDSSAAMFLPGDALDYYLNPRRGAIPEWGGRFGVMAWKEWLEFDPIALAPRIAAPIRIITSEQSATPGGARQFEAGLPGRHDSVWIEGTQFDFYDNPNTVRSAAQSAIEHLQSTLQ